MSGFIGTTSGLLELQYQGGLSTETDRPVSSMRTLGGKRKLFVGAGARREWDVSFDLIGSRDASGLVEIARSASEVMWYPADAAAGNLLSPQAAGWAPVPANATDAGLVKLPDGTVARAIAHTGSSSVYPGDAHGGYEAIPVRPGVPVSVGAWALGGARFLGFWRDVNMASISNWTTTTRTHAGWQWVQDTLTPPTGAVYMTLGITAGIQYARPSVSWGTTAVDRPGRGCPKAVVHGLSEALLTMPADDAYGSISVTITEAG